MNMPVSIPVIDIESVVIGKPHTDVVRAIRDACDNVGFLQVVGHRIDPNLLNRVYDVKDELVALPLEDKQQLVCPTGHPFRGWRYNTSDAGFTISERFQACNFDDHEAAAAAGIGSRYLDYFHPNVWPELPTFQPLVRQWFGATRQLGAIMMSLFAEALDLLPDYFSPMLVQDVSCFAMNVYSGQLVSESEVDPFVLLPAHGDSGTLTILHQRGEYEGLQVQTRTGDWVTVPIMNEAFVINVGDLMTRWTNGLWASTKHRVVAPLVAGQGRTSLTTFYLPSVDTVIAPLPGLGEPSYSPVTPYEWEEQYLARSFRKVDGSYVRQAVAAY
jgi:isopenicillin N synthase-like dioxygenase